MNVIRRHIVFRGWVQGVGFRWRACHAAGMVGATGWVKNEYDGSVTMEIQGTELYPHRESRGPHPPGHRR